MMHSFLLLLAMNCHPFQSIFLHSNIFAIDHKIYWHSIFQMEKTKKKKQIFVGIINNFVAFDCSIFIGKAKVYDTFAHSIGHRNDRAVVEPILFDDFLEIHLSKNVWWIAKCRKLLGHLHQHLCVLLYYSRWIYLANLYRFLLWIWNFQLSIVNCKISIFHFFFSQFFIWYFLFVFYSISYAAISIYIMIVCYSVYKLIEEKVSSESNQGTGNAPTASNPPKYEP